MSIPNFIAVDDAGQDAGSSLRYTVSGGNLGQAGRFFDLATGITTALDGFSIGADHAYLLTAQPVPDPATARFDGSHRAATMATMRR